MSELSPASSTSAASPESESEESEACSSWCSGLGWTEEGEEEEGVVGVVLVSAVVVEEEAEDESAGVDCGGSDGGSFGLILSWTEKEERTFKKIVRSEPFRVLLVMKVEGVRSQRRPATEKRDSIWSSEGSCLRSDG